MPNQCSSIKGKLYWWHQSIPKENKLANNGEKAECFLFVTNQQLDKVKFDSINVDGVKITIKNSVKNLGIMFDKSLSMEVQVKKKL